jgi:hypothetical protein
MKFLRAILWFAISAIAFVAALVMPKDPRNQLTRIWSEIQLTSQFLPPSFEYDCSK